MADLRAKLREAAAEITTRGKLVAPYAAAGYGAGALAMGVGALATNLPLATAATAAVMWPIAAPAAIFVGGLASMFGLAAGTTILVSGVLPLLAAGTAPLALVTHRTIRKRTARAKTPR